MSLCFAISGATGFLGRHLVHDLVRKGMRVKALVRDGEKAKQVIPEINDVIIGDICDEAALAQLTEGADIVIHTVSNFRTASGPEESYIKTNLEGTQKIIEAARKSGVNRFVHCSTIGVHGSVQDTPATEKSAYNPGDLYQITKKQAEQHCIEQIDKSDMQIVIVRPCSMYGPEDMRMLKMFKMLSKKVFFTVGPCKENFHAVYIDDIVNGFHLAATTPDIDGELFIIGGDNYLPLKEYIRTAAHAVDSSFPYIRLPYGPMYFLAWLCEKVFVPLRIEPPLHRRRLRFYKNNRAFDISKAREMLAYDPQIQLAEGMRRTVKWYKDNGYLQ